MLYTEYILLWKKSKSDVPTVLAGLSQPGVIAGGYTFSVWKNVSAQY